MRDILFRSDYVVAIFRLSSLRCGFADLSMILIWFYIDDVRRLIKQGVGAQV